MKAVVFLTVSAELRMRTEDVGKNSRPREETTSNKSALPSGRGWKCRMLIHDVQPAANRPVEPSAPGYWLCWGGTIFPLNAKTILKLAIAASVQSILTRHSRPLLHSFYAM